MNNKGFTLIEVIVTIAIMGMVYMQLKEFLSISVLLFWMVLKLLLAGKR